MNSERSINKILVVDDDMAICMLLMEFLTQQGYCPYSATNPVKALEILEHDNFDLMISDIRMPGMSGIDLLHAAHIKYTDLSIIIMTGFADDYTYSDIINAGAADFIGKPIAILELKAKLERIDREKQALRELQEVNTALRVVLRTQEEDKNQLCASIIANTRQFILPYVDKLRGCHLDQTQRLYLDILESNIKEISSPLITKLSQKYPDLTHMEMQIAGLIKSGKRNKEMAEILGVSINTIMTHRHHLRKKLDLQKDNSNLRSYLQSIDF
jgi:FixJ family two-component response regulator